MKPFWHEEAIIWYRRAARYAGYFDALADILMQWLTPGETVSDIGCGPGLLADALMVRGLSVRGYDICDIAIEDWNRRRTADGKTSCGQVADVFTRNPNAFAADAVLAGHFGRKATDFDFLLRIPAKQYLFIKNMKRSETVRGRARATADEVAAHLHARGLDYESVPVGLAFHQPLKDEAELQRFCTFYGIKQPTVHRTAGKYPLLVEKKKRMTVLCARRKEAL
ncbi:MAG: hypothetical protein Q4P30_02675 [Eubacteriales bacterium]|nr:hypothetical protein [Eubacteriales bacterium]